MAKLTGLDALLGASTEQESQVYIPRLKTSFTVRALTNDDFRKATDQASHNVKGEKVVDNRLLNAVLVAKGCVDPDFSNKSLIEKYEATDAPDCVSRALLPGELAKVLGTIMELSGFGNEDELVEEAKN